MPPKFEAFYRFLVNDNIHISPVVQVITHPGNQDANGKIFTGTLRTNTVRGKGKGRKLRLTADNILPFFCLSVACFCKAVPYCTPHCIFILTRIHPDTNLSTNMVRGFYCFS